VASVFPLDRVQGLPPPLGAELSGCRPTASCCLTLSFPCALAVANLGVCGPLVSDHVLTLLVVVLGR
jgi:hypothetical protein